MDEFFKMLFNAENLRMLIILAVGIAGFVWLKNDLHKELTGVNEKIAGVDGKIAGVREELKADIAGVNEKIAGVREELKADIAGVNEKIAGVREELKADIAGVREELQTIKANDIAHLYAGIRAVAYVLLKNNFIKSEDTKYIDDCLTPPK